MKLTCEQVARAALGEPIKRRGAELFWRVPWRDDQDPSLQVHTVKNCWSDFPSGLSGNAWELAARFAGCDPSDKPVVKVWLRERGLLSANGKGRRIVKTYDYVDEAGKLLYQNVRYQPKHFNQRRPNGKGGWVWDLKGVRLVPYRLPEWKDKEIVCVPEGEKDADGLWDWDIPATTNAGGTGMGWREEYNPHFAGKSVVILTDNDEPGEDFARKKARHLFPVAKEVKIIRFPGLPLKGDFSDWKAAGGTREKLLDLFKSTRVLAAADIAAWDGEGTSRHGRPKHGDRGEQTSNSLVTGNTAEVSELPTIVGKNRQLRDVSTEALRALLKANRPPEIFVRSGALSRVSKDEHDRSIIQTLTEPQLRNRLTRTANYIAFTKEDKRQVSPPEDVVKDILAMGSWPGVLPLDGIVEIPILRPDGTVLDSPGYDPETRLLYAPAPGLKLPQIPSKPTSTELAAALGLIEETIGDFPFVDRASKANTVALLLTPVIRPCIRSMVPLGLIDAPQAGTGKSLLADVITLTTTGRCAAMMGAPREEEEWRKQITSVLIEGATTILIDNIVYPLASASLSRVLTAPEWKDRILGRNQTVTVRPRATWMATGNNIQLGGDLPRRCYWIRIDAKMARPWKRKCFRHPNLIPWVTEKRGELLAALLTLARAWYAAGRPQWSGPVLGSFEDWTTTVGSILNLAGIKGFLENLEQMYEIADIESPQWEAFLITWYEEHQENPVAVAEIEEAIENKHSNLDKVLPDSLRDALHAKNRSFARSLGRTLSQRVGRRYGDSEVYVERAEDEKHTKVARWRVRCLQKQPESGGVSSVYLQRNPAESSHGHSARSTSFAGSAGFDASRSRGKCERGAGKSTCDSTDNITSRRPGKDPANPADYSEPIDDFRFNPAGFPPSEKPEVSSEGGLPDLARDHENRHGEDDQEEVIVEDDASEVEWGEI